MKAPDFPMHSTVEESIRLSDTVDWAFFWRQSVHDGIYGPPGNLLRSGRTSRVRRQRGRAYARAWWLRLVVLWGPTCDGFGI